MAGITKLSQLARLWSALMALALLAAPAVGATKKHQAAAPVPEDIPDNAPKALPVIEEVEAPAASGPNILFILVSDLNDWLGDPGQSHVPNMDRLAHRGMRFLNASSASPLGNASRTALLTGMNPWSTGVSEDQQDWRRSVPLIGKLTLPDYFRSKGYFTAAAGEIFHASPGGPEGRLTGWGGGRRGYELDHAWRDRFPEPGLQLPDSPVHPKQDFNGLHLPNLDWSPIEKSDDEMDDAKVAAWAAQFFQRKLDRPFFLAVGLSHPQPPWYAPKKYFDLLPLDQIKLPEMRPDDSKDLPGSENAHQLILQKNLWKQAVQAYLANAAFADAMVGRVLDALEQSPHAKDTIICLTSDHGQYLGQRQRWQSGGLWEESLHVPLVITAPGVTKSEAQTAQAVSLVDLYPTLCDLASLPKPEQLEGASLVPLLKDPSTKRDLPAISSTGSGDQASYSLRSDRWRYLHYSDGREELYDHSTDPHEWTNLAANVAFGTEKAAFIQKLPQQWHSATRAVADLHREDGAGGVQSFWFAAGDEFSAKDSPDITGRALDIEAQFLFNPRIDGDATLISQGDAQLGWAVHFINGKPAFTINYDGLHTTLCAQDPISPGRVTLRALLSLDGTLAIHADGMKEPARGYAPMTGGFPRKPIEGLQVSHAFGPLSRESFPNSAPYDGDITLVRLSLLPGSPVITGRN